MPNVPAEGICSVNFKNGFSPSEKVFVVDFSKPFANNGSRGRVNIANSSGKLEIDLYLIDSGPLHTRETEVLNIYCSSGSLTLYLVIINLNRNLNGLILIINLSIRNGIYASTSTYVYLLVNLK